MNRTNEKTTKIPCILQSCGLDSVILKDPYLINAAKKTLEYLLSLEPKRFLHHFYIVSGLTPSSSGYGGWEGYDGSSYWNFRGHMFGHYMSALSQAYRANLFGSRNELSVKIKDAVNGLKDCRDAYAANNPESTGYISAFPEADLDIVQGTGGECKRTVWVPWYNLHKVLAGVIDIYKNVMCEDIKNTALSIASEFGNYIHSRTSSIADKSTLLSVEYGGMNDALYELYSITGDIKHKKAAECFDETRLFTRIIKEGDILNGLHANTAIPKFIGALKRYSVFSFNADYYNTLTEQEKNELPDYLAAARKFWDIVVSHHTYVTGGNSQGEHFHKPDSLGQHVNSAKTCETCNSYNMLKLTENLYKITGEKKYADYYENTFINSILSSQNPDTGMMTYFQPVGTGHNKVYNEKFEHFYCCTGTGIESFTKLNGSIYHIDSERNIYVNMYFSSVLEYDNLALEQESDIPNKDIVKFTVASGNGSAFRGVSLFFRVPDWSGAPSVAINGKETKCADINGYLEVRDLSVGDIIELRLPMDTEVCRLSDMPEIVAFKYGPVVLSTGLGCADIDKTDIDGVNVRISVLDEKAPQTIALAMNAITDVKNNLFRIEDSEGGQIQFQLRGTDFIFTPHFMRHNERYGLYMILSVKA